MHAGFETILMTWLGMRNQSIWLSGSSWSPVPCSILWPQRGCPLRLRFTERVKERSIEVWLTPPKSQAEEIELFHRHRVLDLELLPTYINDFNHVYQAQQSRLHTTFHRFKNIRPWSSGIYQPWISRRTYYSLCKVCWRGRLGGFLQNCRSHTSYHEVRWIVSRPRPRSKSDKYRIPRLYVDIWVHHFDGPIDWQDRQKLRGDPEEGYEGQSSRDEQQCLATCSIVSDISSESILACIREGFPCIIIWSSGENRGSI